MWVPVTAYLLGVKVVAVSNVHGDILVPAAMERQITTALRTGISRVFEPKDNADYFREAAGKFPSAKCLPMR